MSLGDKYPYRYKFWSVLKKITFNLFLWISKHHDKIEKIHYDYWTHGKTLKELKILKQRQCHNYQTGDCNKSYESCNDCEDHWIGVD